MNSQIYSCCMTINSNTIAEFQVPCDHSCSLVPSPEAIAAIISWDGFFLQPLLYGVIYIYVEDMHA